MVSSLRDRIDGGNREEITPNKGRSHQTKRFAIKKRESRLPAPKSISLRDRIDGHEDVPKGRKNREHVKKRTYPSDEEVEATVDLHGRRIVPPAQHPITNTVCVQGLSRPFNVSEFKIQLNNIAGERAAFFWVDKLRTHCFAIYSNTESTTKIRGELHGLGYPAHGSAKLDVDFVPEPHVGTWIKDEERADTLTRWIVRYVPTGDEVVPVHEPDPSSRKRIRTTSAKPKLEWEEAPQSSIDRRERYSEKEMYKYLLRQHKR